MRMKLTIKNASQLLRERGIGPGLPVQLLVAQSAIRRMRKYTPQSSAALAGSAKVAKGGREIHQYTPYARIQYQRTDLRHHGVQTHHWFDAMKKNGGVNAILREARRRAGAR